mgnify:CR=1 FL=1
MVIKIVTLKSEEFRVVNMLNKRVFEMKWNIP